MFHRMFVSVLLFLLPTVPAFALSPLIVGAESVENYSGCRCASGNLNYANDQTSLFMNRIDDWHRRKFLYQNSHARNSDVVEDQMNGNDHRFGDTVHLLLISGHGSQSSTTFSGYLCSGTCSFNSGQLTLGEQTGQSYSTNPGLLRFLILATCYSVDAQLAATVWRPVFARGRNLMYVMGYHGVSVDSDLTKEVPQDFAQKAAGEGWSLKQAWFWAIEDAWHDDIGSLVTSGDTETEAVNNRESMTLTSDPNVSAPTWMAWAWHQG